MAYENITPAVELAIVRAMAEGKNNKAIADILCMEIHTVEQYKSYLYRKHNANNGPHLVAIAYRLGLLKPAERGYRFLNPRLSEAIMPTPLEALEGLKVFQKAVQKHFES